MRNTPDRHAGHHFVQPAHLLARGVAHPLRLSVARGFVARARGLIAAPPLPHRAPVLGLLLPHCTAVHGLGLLAPLDLLFLSDGVGNTPLDPLDTQAPPATRALVVAHTARLPRFGVRWSRHTTPHGPVRHTLELPAGTLTRWGVQPGDRLILDGGLP